jgi:hypothetical protein
VNIKPRFTPQQQRLYDACLDLIEKGVKPTPTELEKIDPKFVTRKGTNITLSHGRLTHARALAFLEAGWVFKPGNSRFPETNGRWVK